MITITLILLIIAVLILVVYFWRKPEILKRCLRFVSNKKIATLAEVVLLLSSSYFLFVKKGFNFSLTDFLISHIPNWPKELVYYSIYSIYAIIFASIVIKLITLICEKLKILERGAISPDGMKTLCLNLNREIESHLNKLDGSDKKKFLKDLNVHHHFEQNLGLIVLSMVEHVAESLKIDQKRKDVFVSIYAVKDFEKGLGLSEFDSSTNEFMAISENRTYTLNYLTHWDATSAHRYSERIDINAVKYQQYECVKAYKLRKYIHTSVDSKNYHCDPNNPRAKTTESFLCFFITIGDVVVGLVNVEFHNNKIFDTDEDMIQYIQSDLMPFKYMIQYQFLKKRFLNVLSS